MSKLKFKAVDGMYPPSTPNYGNAKKTFIDKMGIHHEEGMPLLSPSAEPALISIGDVDFEGRPAFEAGIRISFEAGYMVSNNEETGETTITIMANEADALIRVLNAVKIRALRFGEAITNDPTVCHLEDL